MNIFTSFFLLLLLLQRQLPSATDTIPFIGAYYCLNMMVTTLATIACTIIVHIYYRGENEVPWLLRKIFLIFLARLFLMKASFISIEKAKNDKLTPDSGEKSKIHAKIRSFTDKANFKLKRTSSLNTYSINLKKNNKDLNFSLSLMRNDTKEMRDYISHMQKKLANVDSRLKHTRDWKMLALVIDRFLFFLYIFGIGIATLLFLF